MPLRTGLSGSQFSTLNSAGINDSKGPEKYNNTEVKYGATFYSCNTSLDTCYCQEIKKSMGSIKDNKLQVTCRLGLTESVHEG
jgi:hypothetical protein